MTVTFVLDDTQPLEALAALAPDRDWQSFVTGEHAWILQTYLRLKAAGHAVHLAGRLPEDGIAVFSSKQRHALYRSGPKKTRAILVATRADVGPAQIADFEIVQNGAQADGRRRFFIPHWPQPALVPRDTARGARIENLAFKGFIGNLHAGFQSAEWHNALERQGLKWRADAVPYARQGVRSDALAWNDFRELDLIVAVRPPDRAPYPRKPATKLYNAWHAGVPAILGPEIAYRELRQSPLDYIEVSTPQQALQAIAELRADPRRYLAMIEHGRARAAEFSVERNLERWAQLLFVELPALSASPHVRRWQGRPLFARKLARTLLPFTNI